MEELLKKLTEIDGPCGFEDRVRELIRPEIEPYADEITVDAMGNLIALKRGDGTGKKVMIAAHMDEIGVMVTHITKEGFLRFTGMGAVFPFNIMGNRVRFPDGTIGIVNCDRNEDSSKLLPLEKYFIDVGAKDRETCPIKVGTPAAFIQEFFAQGNRLSCKSMDNRVGCYVAIEAFRTLKPSPHDLYFVFSVQEEVGTRGAQAAANGILPDVGIAIDVTPTGDTPAARPMPVALGKGPAIKVKDLGMIAHPGLVREMRACADEIGIDYQLEVLTVGSTDARSMQIAGPGSAAGCISIPCRYVHSQSEVVDSDDVRGAVELLVALLQRPFSL